MYRYERFTQDKIDDLLRLFLESDKTKVSREKFVKKYQTNYLGVSYVGYFAYDENNKPAAFYGVIPTEAHNKQGEPVLVAQSADTITHPNHQKKGLFVKLAEMTYQLATELNIHFLYGIPNYLSYPGFVKKLGWTHEGNLQKFNIHLKTIPLGNLAKRLAAFNGIYQKYASLIINFPSQKTENQTFTSCKNEFQILATPEFMHYKSYTPKHLRKIAGCTVWLSVDSYLKIGEIQGLTEENAVQFLKTMKRIAFLVGAHKIVYQCNTIHENHDILIKHIHPEEELPIIFKNLSNKYHIVDFALKYADVDTF
jgi:hypothetical protein